QSSKNQYQMSDHYQTALLVWISTSSPSFSPIIRHKRGKSFYFNNNKNTCIRCLGNLLFYEYRNNIVRNSLHHTISTLRYSRNSIIIWHAIAIHLAATIVTY